MGKSDQNANLNLSLIPRTKDGRKESTLQRPPSSLMYCGTLRHAYALVSYFTIHRTQALDKIGYIIAGCKLCTVNQVSPGVVLGCAWYPAGGVIVPGASE